MHELTQSKRKRLAYIDFRLFFLGSVGRSNLVARFGIKEAAATRDITDYRDRAPENIEYDRVSKIYRTAENFQPLFDHIPVSVLTALTHGYGDSNVAEQKALIPSVTPSQLSKPSLEILSVLTRAITASEIVSINYRSLSSGLTQREILPHALVDNGLRWHVRAFDRRRSRFTDFVLTRITNPTLFSNSDADQSESANSDDQWNRIVELELAPHPKIHHTETVELDYGMQDGVLNISVRAAVAGYLLRRWNIDCTTTGTLEGDEFHLWLRNRQTLYGVDNLVIAPGYDEGL